MQENTVMTLFLIAAAIILFVKNISIRNINSRFAISEDIKETKSVYGRLFSFVKYKIKRGPLSMGEWIRAQKEERSEQKSEN